MNKTLKKFGGAALVALIATLIISSGILYRVDNMAADLLYQQPLPATGNIFMVGIDPHSLEVLGPYASWGRDVIAQAIETLNRDPEHRPAAIGLDILFISESDPEADAFLVSAAAMHDNVVAASVANFDSALVEDDAGNFYMEEYTVQSYDEPFSALRDVTVQGHINAMYDRDGFLRHSILYVDLPDGRRIPSFNYVLFEKFAAFNGLDAEYLPPLDLRNRWYVPYSSMPGDYYEGFGISDLIAGDIPPDFYEGKIVLIGPYAAGLADYVFTPIDRAQLMFGVEFQANCIDALIAGEFKESLRDLPQLLALFFVAFFALAWFWDRKVLPATVVWLIVAGGYIGLCLLAYERLGYILHPLWIPLVVTILYVATVAINYMRAQLEKRRVTNTFKRYVAPEIVNEILKEGAEDLGLGGKMTDIAVLFVDIRGFTPMSEILNPEQVVEILNQYLELTSSCIMRNGGTLDKFIGDATMAFWGAPLPQDDYIYKAVKTGMEMIEGSKALSEELEKRFGRTVSFGIGVHCGQAVVGNIGAQNRMDYTAIGDTVNTSARLESNAPPGKMYVSRTVADALEGRIIAKSLGDTIKLKGKAEGFEILEVEGLAE